MKSSLSDEQYLKSLGFVSLQAVILSQAAASEGGPLTSYSDDRSGDSSTEINSSDSSSVKASSKMSVFTDYICVHEAGTGLTDGTVSSKSNASKLPSVVKRHECVPQSTAVGHSNPSSHSSSSTNTSPARYLAFDTATGLTATSTNYEKSSSGWTTEAFLQDKPNLSKSQLLLQQQQQRGSIMDDNLSNPALVDHHMDGEPTLLEAGRIMSEDGHMMGSRGILAPRSSREHHLLTNPDQKAFCCSEQGPS
jgi:hypothetical protein